MATGARSRVGGAVMTELLAAGETVRASSRDPEAADLPAGVEVVRARELHSYLVQDDNVSVS